jgi:hypothetical protein
MQRGVAVSQLAQALTSLVLIAAEANTCNSNYNPS